MKTWPHIAHDRRYNLGRAVFFSALAFAMVLLFPIAVVLLIVLMHNIFPANFMCLLALVNHYGRIKSSYFDLRSAADDWYTWRAFLRELDEIVIVDPNDHIRLFHHEDNS